MNSFLRLLFTASALISSWSIMPAFAQAPAFDRAIACASGQGYFGWGPSRTVVDGQGNTYVTGLFNGTVLLGNTLLTATQTNPVVTMPNDVFVAKLDAAGNYLWAVQMGDNQAARSQGLAVDAAGNVYIAGGFNSHSVRFGIGGPVLYNSSAQGEGFVAKLDGATGRWLWARRVGGTGFDSVRGVVANATGDVYIIGNSQSSVVDCGPFTLNAPASFVAKLSLTGTWLWARPVGSGAAVSVGHLCVDGQGGIYVAGGFQAPSATFGATTLTTQGIAGSPYARTGSEVFVAKTNDAGAWAWAVQGDALTHQNLITGLGGLALDGAGHVYLAGAYQSTGARFGATQLPNLSAMQPQPTGQPTPPPYTNNYWPDAFVARLDAATGAWDWAARSGGPSAEGARNIVADAQGRVSVVGTLDRGTLGTDLTQLAQLDGATGAWRSVQTLGPVGVQDLALDGQSRLHLAGFFYSASATFGPVTLAQAGPGLGTGVLARLSAGPLAATAAQAPPSPGLAVWPNPSGRGPVWVQGPKSGQPVEVFDALGRRVAQGKMPSNGPLELQLPALLPPGVYVVRGGGQAQRLLLE